MAAPNGTPTRLGSVNGAVSNFAEQTALFDVEFAELIYGAFETENKAMNRFQTRTLSEGSGARFLFTGTSAASYHTPGTYLVGDAFLQAEKRINIDPMLIDTKEIAEIDDLMKHWDVKQEMARKMGHNLAKTIDQNILRCGIRGARSTSAIVTGGAVGGTLNDTDAATNADSLATSIFAGLQAFDEKDVPQEDRVIWVRPAQYNLLIQNQDAINRDWGGMGSYADGTIFRIGGAEVVKTNNLENTNYTDPASVNNTYTVDGRNTVALLTHRDAVGTVKLLDVTFAKEWDIRTQTWVLTAKMAVGHDFLRQESAFEIRTADPV